MATNASAPERRTTHLVPTHIRTPETLITLAGISLSVKQFLLLLIGSAFSYQIWLVLAVLVRFPAGQVLRWVLTPLPLLVALALAFVSLAARSLDAWCLAVLRYALRPHRYVWRSVRFVDPGLAGMVQEEEETDGTHPT